MKIKIFIAGLFALFFGENLLAQKEIYIPNQMYEEGYSETDESQQWCKIRSRESDNIIVFWANGYGQNDPNSGSVPSEYRVDVDDLLKWVHSFKDSRIFVHAKFDMYFDAVKDVIKAGKPWIHFNIAWEDEYILEHDNYLK